MPRSDKRAKRSVRPAHVAKALVGAISGLLVSSRPSEAETVWTQPDISGVHLGMDCLQAMRTLEAHKFQRVGESPETALDFSTLVALELGTHAKASGVPELTAFELNGVERIEMRCESRPEGPTVWFVDYEFSSNSIPASETVARLVAKYGPPAWKSDDALGGAPALDWSPVPIRNDSVLSNTPRLRYGGSKTDGQFTLRLQEGFDLHDAYKEELKQAVAIAAHGKQTGPHF